MSGEFLKGIALVDRTTGKPLDLDELETVTKAATGGEWSVEEDFGPG